MGKTALLFPGQGAQRVGMGREAFEAWPKARAVFESADAALGESLSRLCFDGPEEALRLTANTQPAVLTTSIALLAGLELHPDAVAGHSLGEYSAHVCAGTLRFEDAVRLVRARGELMQDAVPVGRGAMAAVMGVDAGCVEAACRACAGVCETANYNCPGQTVIAGSAEAVAACAEALRAEGAKVMPLAVSAPFHSSLMKPAEEKLAVLLRRVSFSEPGVPVYVNVDAVAVSSAAGGLDALVRQMSRPVLWEQSVRRMIADGFDTFIEVGPGRVLSGLIARIDRSVRTVAVQAPSDAAR